MKSTVLKYINLFFKLFNLKLKQSSAIDFGMRSSINRIVQHNIKIDTIIDIGASNGSWSLEASEIFPQAHFLAIEALEERAPSLAKIKNNIKNFDFEICIASQKDNDMALLNVATDLDGSTVGGTGGTCREVSTQTIDTLVSKKNLMGPFLLKFDTHGYEIPILEGCKRTLKNTNIIIMEVYNFNITNKSLRFYQMCDHLEKLGFRCYDIADPMHRTHDAAFWQIDLFFCRDDADIFGYNNYA